jgi:hypothetical protein
MQLERGLWEMKERKKRQTQQKPRRPSPLRPLLLSSPLPPLSSLYSDLSDLLPPPPQRPTAFIMPHWRLTDSSDLYSDHFSSLSHHYTTPHRLTASVQRPSSHRLTVSPRRRWSVQRPVPDPFFSIFIFVFVFLSLKMLVKHL